MATRVTRELEHAKHEQDLPAIADAAEARRREDRRRNEQERELELRHEAQVEEQRRQDFIDKNRCP